MSAQDELQEEALRRAWVNASYRAADYQAGAKEVPAVSLRELAIAIAIAALCWAIIGGGVWFVWRLF
jgi:hypothetical protein